MHRQKAQERRITVLNTPGRNARSVAEFTVGLLFAEMRNIARSHAAMQAGNWRKDFPNSAAVPELEGRTIGLVGFGHVGQLVGKFLQGFDARIVFFDPYFNGVTSFEQVDLNTLLHEADVVSLHGRLTEETAGMIGARELTQMKQTAILINTARSGLVKEPDLIHALQTNEIAGAAIDTFDQEPLEADSPFLKLDNVTVTSHMAGSTSDAFRNTPKKLAIRVLKC
ncbi:D-3-phosphoglycerate dehydrogenase [Bacillus sp. JCM 19045]|nr:D-3-phosphoglycerate dehydrogenase [Bacillus sp. JCM 19045]